MLFIIYSATDSSSIENSLGLPEYSYYFVLKEFRPMLEKLGRVQLVKHPETEVDALYDECLARGEPCVFLSFSPPNKTLTTLRCPTIPVFAWEFDTLPDEVWDDEPNNDWTQVLRTLGRAITHSRHTVATIRRALGDDFPVISVPAPVWDRFQPLRDKYPPSLSRGPVTLNIRGSVIDSREMQKAVVQGGDQPALLPYRKSLRYRLGATKRHAIEWYRDVIRDLLPGRLAALLSNSLRQANWKRQQRNKNRAQAKSPETAPISLTLDGIIYTAVFNPCDGRKNWLDMLSAFLEAFSECPDATLAMKFTHLNSDWAFAMLKDALHRAPAFQCRVLAIHGFLESDSYDQLIAASTYTVNSSLGEGQCLPLMEFMACGKPAIAPRNTAMEDYIDEEVAFIVASSEEPCCWPHDSRMVHRAHRHRLDWASLRDALRASYQVATRDPERYLHMANESIRRQRDNASHWVALEKLGVFFGLRQPPEVHLQQQPEELPSLPMDLPNRCGLHDAVMSGWFNTHTGELVSGFRIASDDVVVDVGCGSGGASLFCARQGATVYFSDLEEYKVAEVDERLKATGNTQCFGLVSDTNPLPLADATASRVLAMEMLEHVDDPEQVMRELVRIGRPGALYLLSVPDAKGEHLQKEIAAPGHFEAPNHVRIFSREGFARLVEDSGLIIEQRQYAGFYWVIWMYLFWAYQKHSGLPYEGATLNKITPPYPEVLENWAETWLKLLEAPEGPAIKKLLDESLAKNQLIIARKPERSPS